MKGSSSTYSLLKAHQTFMAHSATDMIRTMERENSLERLQFLYKINSMLKQVEADGLNIYVILPRVINLAVRQLDADEGSIIVVDEGQDVQYAWSTKNKLNEKRSDQFLGNIMNEGVAGTVVRDKAPIIIDNTITDPRWLPRPGSMAEEEPWSILCTPFLIRERAIGAITLHKAGAHSFNDDDLDFLQAISNQAASSIENARLYEATQRQLKISALLNEASRAINSSLEIDEILKSLLTQMNEFLNAEALSIALVDNATNELEYRVAEGVGSDKIIGLRLPANKGLSGWVMDQGKPAIVQDTTVDSRFTLTGDERTGHITRAMICAPMQFQGEVLGTIQAINPIEGTFTQDDLDLLINLANIASTALANAQQFARTQAAEARYTSLFQDTVDPILLTDLDGYIVEANRRAFSLFGYGRNEIIGMHIQKLHPNTEDFPTIDKIRADKVVIFASDVLTNNKQNLPVEVYAKRTHYLDNEVLQWIHHDISKQVELEEMRQDLTAMLFHDLQSPLGNVISSLELLTIEASMFDTNETINVMIDIAKRSSYRLQTLIRSLLDINRLEAGQPIKNKTFVNFRQLIDEVEEIERPNFEQRRIRFVKEVSPTVPLFKFDEDMIRRVVINLTSNALKYSQHSQKITIVADTRKEENTLLVSVCDQGDGIPPKYRQSIFEKFERIKQSETSSKGLGLGLAFCRLAVEAHGGKIWVDDAPGGGARFNFTLPLIQ